MYTKVEPTIKKCISLSHTAFEKEYIKVKQIDMAEIGTPDSP